MAFFCEYITETDKKESLLYKQLKDSYSNETIAEIEYNFVHSPQFKEWFGDWVKDWSSKEKSIDAKLVNEQGEPRIFSNAAGELYYINNDGDTLYLTGSSKWENDFDSAERAEIIDSFAYYFYNNFLKNDEGFIDRNTLEAGEGSNRLNQALLSFLKVKQNSNIDQNIIDKIADNILYLKKDIIEYFAAKKITIQEEEVEEDKKLAEFNTKESYTVNSKDRAPSNIKLMLSFIPKVNDNYEEVKNEILDEPTFVEFDRIWNLLEKNLANLYPHQNTDGTISSVYNQMYNKIVDLVEIEPSLLYLLDILNKKESDIDFINMFVQAFYKTEKKFLTTTISGTKGRLNYKIFNSQVNSIDKDIVKTWETYFFTDPNSIYNAENKTVNVSKLNSLTQELKNARVSIAKSSGDAKVSEMRKFINSLKESTGIWLSDKAINSIINNNKEGDVLSNIGYFIDNVKRNPNLKVKNVEKSPFEENSGYLLEVAQYEAKFVPEYTENTVIGKNGMNWSYSNITYLELLIGMAKAGDITELKQRRNLPYYKHSIWLDEIIKAVENKDTEFLDNLNIHTFNNLKSENAGDIGEDNKSINVKDAIADNIAKTFKPGKPVLNMLEPADKGSFYQISGFDLVRTGTASIKTSGKTNTPYVSFSDNTALDLMVNYFRDEYRRIKKVWNDVNNGVLTDPIENYHSKNGKLVDENGMPVGNGFKSILFPELSPENMVGTDLNKDLKLYKDTGEPISDDLTTDDIIKLKKYIRFSLGKTIYNDINKMQKLGIIDSKFKNVAIPKDALERFKEFENPLISLLTQYSVNGIIANIEMTKLFIGDPAYYKNMVDLKKRVPASYTDGMVLNINEENRYYNASVIKDYERGSTFFMNYINDDSNITRIVDELSKEGVKTTKSEVKDILNDYKNTNQADAQAYITPQRYKTIMKGLGKWDKNVDAAFIRAMDGTASVDDYKLLAKEPLKGVYFSVQNGKPTYLKYSQAILWPRLISGTELEKLVNKMNNSFVDEVIFESGVKVGGKNPVEIHDFETGLIKDDFELPVMTLDNRFWKLQQDLKSKGMKDTDIGSQIQKNIMANISLELDYEFDGEKINGAELINKLVNAVGELSGIGVTEIKNDLGITDDGTITDIDKLKSIIRSEARDQGDNVLRALDKDYDLDAIFQIKRKMIPVIFSYIKKRVSKIQSNGGSFVQMSSFGLDKMTNKERNGIYWLQDPDTLKAPHIDSNGVLKPGEVLISHSMIAKYIPNYRSYKPSELLKKIDNEILELVGYRIPNQGLSSNDIMKVVGILPREMGDTIIPYTEITMKTGSDFDIDKMYIMVPQVRAVFNNRTKVISNYVKSNFTPIKTAMVEAKLISKGKIKIEDLIDAVSNKILDNEDIITDDKIAKIKLNIENLLNNEKEDAVRINYIDHNGNSKYALQNRILSIYKSILKDKKTYLEMMTSIDKNTRLLKDYINTLHGATIKTGLEHFSPVEELILKDSLQSGKNGVGVTANNLVDHPLAQLSEMAISRSFKHGNIINENSTSLGGVYDSTGSQKITQMISAFLNGFVDIAKDSWIIRGNYTDYTSPTAFALIRMGFNYKFVTAFIGQPILKDYSRLKSIANSRTGEKLLDAVIVEALRKRYSGLKGKELKNFLKDLDVRDESINDFTLDNLESMIYNYGPEHFSNQVKVLETFLKLKGGIVKTLQDNISVSKSDVNGPGGSIPELVVTLNKFSNIVSSGHIINFRKKMTDTTAGVFFNNAVMFTNSIMNGLFMEFTPVFNNLESSLATILDIEDPSELFTNNDFITFIHNEFYSFLLSKNTVLKDDNFERLFKGNDSIAARLNRLKKDDSVKNNFLVKNLKVDFNPNGFSYVGVRNSKNQPLYFKNAMSNGWKELLFSDNEDLRMFANDLVKYSFYSSGFHQTLSSIHNFVPSEWMQLSGFLNDIKRIKNEILNSNSYNYYDFYKYLAKNYYDKSFGKYRFTNLITKRDSTNSLVSLDKSLAAIPESKAFVLAYDKGEYVTRRFTVETNFGDKIKTVLYKAIGTDLSGSSVLYAATNTLGINKGINNIKEFDASKASIDIDNNKSAFDANKQSQVMNKLGFVDYVPRTGSFTFVDVNNSIIKSYKLIEKQRPFIEREIAPEVEEVTEVQEESMSQEDKDMENAPVLNDIFKKRLEEIRRLKEEGKEKKDDCNE